MARGGLRLLQQAHQQCATTSTSSSTRRSSFRWPGIIRAQRLHGPRSNLLEHRGFSAFVVMAHTNAIFSPPGIGGVLLDAAARRFPDRSRPEVQRDDQRAYPVDKAHRGLGRIRAWRYDSGLVAGAVGELDDALAFTADQQTAIGFSCGEHLRNAGSAPDRSRTALRQTTARRDSGFLLRHRRRRDQSAANRAAAPLRPRPG